MEQGRVGTRHRARCQDKAPFYDREWAAAGEEGPRTLIIFPELRELPLRTMTMASPLASMAMSAGVGGEVGIYGWGVACQCVCVEGAVGIDGNVCTGWVVGDRGGWLG